MNNNPLVSIVVTTKNSQEFLENCLKSIKSQTYKNLEIIVVDNNSLDKTKDIAKEYTKHIFNIGPERSAQRNFGAEKSKGKYLLFIDSDMELSKNVVKECVEKMDRFKALIIPEKSFGKGFWAKCKGLERSFYVGVDWIEAARLFDKRVFQNVGGYDIKQTGTEDYDLPQKIKDKFDNKAVGRINSYIFHNEGSLTLYHSLSKKFYYTKTANVYNKKNKKYFSKQSNLVNRYVLYFSNPVKLFKSPILGIGMLTMKTLEFAAGGFGYFLSK